MGSRKLCRRERDIKQLRHKIEHLYSDRGVPLFFVHLSQNENGFMLCFSIFNLLIWCDTVGRCSLLFETG